MMTHRSAAGGPPTFRPSAVARGRSPSQRHLDDGFSAALTDVVGSLLAEGDRRITESDLDALAHVRPSLDAQPACYREGYARGLASFVQDHVLNWTTSAGDVGLVAPSTFGGHYAVAVVTVGKTAGVRLWVPGQDRMQEPFASVTNGTEARLVAQAHYSKQVAKPYIDAARQARLAAGLPADPPSREDWLEGEVLRLRAMIPADAEAMDVARASRQGRAEDLLRLVENFVKTHEISCAESVFQMDSIMVAMPELVGSLVAVAGYATDRDDALDMVPQD